MSAGHPPGPYRVTIGNGDWRAVHDGNGTSAYQEIVDADGVVIALAVAHLETTDSPQPELHSGLLAASWDLLQAAQAAWNCIAELPPTQARVEAAQMLQTAIERATGAAS